MAGQCADKSSAAETTQSPDIVEESSQISENNSDGNDSLWYFALEVISDARCTCTLKLRTSTCRLFRKLWSGLRWLQTERTLNDLSILRCLYSYSPGLSITISNNFEKNRL